MLEKRIRNKKYTYDQVKSFIEKEGYTLLSNDYINNKNKLDVMCDKGHKSQVRLNDFLNNHRCIYCSGKNKHTYDQVKSFIEKEGYTLLSNDYINNKTKLKIMCDKEHIFEMTYSHLKSGQRCPKCSMIKKADKHRLTYNQVKTIIENEGYYLLSNEYVNNKEKIKIKCDKNHTFNMRFDNFKHGCRCPKCAIIERTKNKTLTYEQVKSFIEKEGYSLLSDEYVKSVKKLQLQCPDKHTFNMCFNNFQSGQKCPICSFKDGKSKPEKEIFSYIKSIYNGKIIENDRTQIINPHTNKNLELDIWLPEVRKAIEFNGKYWHSKNDVSVRDIIKKEQCNNKKINLFIIDEIEWIKDKNNCLDLIKGFINE
jgi:hypothetical protein